MIIAERKPLGEILEMIEPCNDVMLVGCRGCVTVCNVGGLKEVQILASELRIARRKEGRPINIDERVIERQCDPEYVEQLRDVNGRCDAVLSMACGVGPQFLAEACPDRPVFPMVNTTFMGGAVRHGVWEERCAGCGTCVIHRFDGMCPVARCSKSLLNGPCGGSNKGKCEISRDVECVWDLIVSKMMAQHRIDELMEFRPAKNWNTARDGGPRRRTMEVLMK